MSTDPVLPTLDSETEPESTGPPNCSINSAVINAAQNHDLCTPVDQPKMDIHEYVEALNNKIKNFDEDMNRKELFKNLATIPIPQFKKDFAASEKSDKHFTEQLKFTERNHLNLMDIIFSEELFEALQFDPSYETSEDAEQHKQYLKQLITPDPLQNDIYKCVVAMTRCESKDSVKFMINNKELHLKLSQYGSDFIDGKILLELLGMNSKYFLEPSLIPTKCFSNFIKEHWPIKEKSEIREDMFVIKNPEKRLSEKLKQVNESRLNLDESRSRSSESLNEEFDPSDERSEDVKKYIRTELLKWKVYEYTKAMKSYKNRDNVKYMTNNKKLQQTLSKYEYQYIDGRFLLELLDLNNGYSLEPDIIPTKYLLNFIKEFFALKENSEVVDDVFVIKNPENRLFEKSKQMNKFRSSESLNELEFDPSDENRKQVKKGLDVQVYPFNLKKSRPSNPLNELKLETEKEYSKPIEDTKIIKDSTKTWTESKEDFVASTVLKKNSDKGIRNMPEIKNPIQHLSQIKEIKNPEQKLLENGYLKVLNRSRLSKTLNEIEFDPRKENRETPKQGLDIPAYTSKVKKFKLVNPLNKVELKIKKENSTTMEDVITIEKPMQIVIEFNGDATTSTVLNEDVGEAVVDMTGTKGPVKKLSQFEENLIESTDLEQMSSKTVPKMSEIIEKFKKISGFKQNVDVSKENSKDVSKIQNPKNTLLEKLLIKSGLSKTLNEIEFDPCEENRKEPKEGLDVQGYPFGVKMYKPSNALNELQLKTEKENIKPLEDKTVIKHLTQILTEFKEVLKDDNDEIAEYIHKIKDSMQKLSQFKEDFVASTRLQEDDSKAVSEAPEIKDPIEKMSKLKEYIGATTRLKQDNGEFISEKPKIINQFEKISNFKENDVSTRLQKDNSETASKAPETIEPIENTLQFKEKVVASKDYSKLMKSVSDIQNILLEYNYLKQSIKARLQESLNEIDLDSCKESRKKPKKSLGVQRYAFSVKKSKPLNPLSELKLESEKENMKPLEDKTVIKDSTQILTDFEEYFISSTVLKENDDKVVTEMPKIKDSVQKLSRFKEDFVASTRLEKYNGKAVLEEPKTIEPIEKMLQFKEDVDASKEYSNVIESVSEIQNPENTFLEYNYFKRLIKSGLSETLTEIDIDPCEESHKQPKKGLDVRGYPLSVIKCKPSNTLNETEKDNVKPLKNKAVIKNSTQILTELKEDFIASTVLKEVNDKFVEDMSKIKDPVQKQFQFEEEFVASTWLEKDNSRAVSESLKIIEPIEKMSKFKEDIVESTGLKQDNGESIPEEPEILEPIEETLQFREDVVASKKNSSVMESVSEIQNPENTLLEYNYLKRLIKSGLSETLTEIDIDACKENHKKLKKGLDVREYPLSVIKSQPSNVLNEFKLETEKDNVKPLEDKAVIQNSTQILTELKEDFIASTVLKEVNDEFVEDVSKVKDLVQELFQFEEEFVASTRLEKDNSRAVSETPEIIEPIEKMSKFKEDIVASTELEQNNGESIPDEPEILKPFEKTLQFKEDVVASKENSTVMESVSEIQNPENKLLENSYLKLLNKSGLSNTLNELEFDPCKEQYKKPKKGLDVQGYTFNVKKSKPSNTLNDLKLEMEKITCKPNENKTVIKPLIQKLSKLASLVLLTDPKKDSGTVTEYTSKICDLTKQLSKSNDFVGTSNLKKDNNKAIGGSSPVADLNHPLSMFKQNSITSTFGSTVKTFKSSENVSKAIKGVPVKNGVKQKLLE